MLVGKMICVDLPEFGASFSSQVHVIHVGNRSNVASEKKVIIRAIENRAQRATGEYWPIGLKLTQAWSSYYWTKELIDRVIQTCSRRGSRVASEYYNISYPRAAELAAYV